MKVKPKCMNLKQLASLYDLDPRTIKKMMQEKGLKVQPVDTLYTVKGVERIFDVLGTPEQ